MSTLAVIPSDPMSAYEAVGCHVWAERYYNPGGCFDNVYLLSPLEKKEGYQYGMQTIPTQPRQLPGRLKKLNVALVRAYGGYWPCDMACQNKTAGVPVVVSVHDTNPKELYDSIQHADYVFCMSEAVRQLVLTKFARPDRVWILPNRYDKEVMRPLPEDNFADLNAAYSWRYKLICIGRISEQKNQDTLIKALKELGPDYGCVFVGRNDASAMKTLASSLGVSDQCAFVESVRNDHLARWYNWADAMVTPSRWEGFGIVFIEAMACGAAVVTSNVAPMNEYIQQGKNGWLVDEYENPVALAEATRQVCEDRELRRQLRENAPGSVTRFERATVDAQEIMYYQRILAETQQGQKGSLLSKLLGPKRAKSTTQTDSSEAAVAKLCANRALEWARKNSITESGVLHSPKHMIPYPEVTGYFIPTLLKLGERDLAVQYGRWLLSIQKPDASWSGFGTDTAYTFDVGQILKGLIALYKHPDLKKTLDADLLERAILRGCNWLCDRIAPDGSVSTPAKDALQLPGGKMVPEAFYLYTLQPLREAGVAFQRPNYLEAVNRTIAYYTRQTDFGAFDTLTHFHAYIVEALLDLDEEKLARKIMQNMQKHQRADGAIPAYPGVPWVCSTGLAQYAVIWMRLGEVECARRAFWYLASIQNASGGFFGGYGAEATYFPDAEISWAVKYFLDAYLLLKDRFQQPHRGGAAPTPPQGARSLTS